jgi:beta-N-acetylhexosaminidase
MVISITGLGSMFLKKGIFYKIRENIFNFFYRIIFLFPNLKVILQNRSDLNYLIKNDFYTFKNKASLFAMTAHIIYQNIDKLNTATHSKKIIKLIRKNIRFKNILMSDDISMKSLKYSIKENTERAFDAGCDLVLHCNGNYKEMLIVAKNSPLISKFIIKKTSQFHRIIS